MSDKTNAIRLLETMGLFCKPFEYDIDNADLSATHAASLAGIPPEKVFKTLVLQDHESNYFTAVLPSDHHLDMKKTALAFHVKKIEILPLKELLKVSGYVRGGCSPVGMKKLFPTRIAEAAQLYDSILVNAGKRGLLMEVHPDELLEITQGEYADLIQL